MVLLSWLNPDPREDPKSRSLNGGSYKVPLVVQGPKLGDLLSRSSRGSGKKSFAFTPMRKASAPTWRFMGSYKWGYKSTNMGDSSSYPTYSPTNNYPKP